jgi:F-type H+-transporting ATPase subunit b
MPRLVFVIIGMMALLTTPARIPVARADDAAAKQTLAVPAEAVTAAPQAHSAEGSHGASVKPEDKVLDFSIPLSIATAIVFVGLLVLLSKFAWVPLARALDERERFQEETLEKAEQARAESERILAEHRELMARANDQVRSLMDEARKNAEIAGNAIVTRAQSEAEGARHRAERDIAQARDQALVEIWSKTADLAVDVAGKVLSREIQPDEHRRLVTTALNDLSSVQAGRPPS